MDKGKTAPIGRDNSDDTFKIMNSQLPVCTEERDLKVTVDHFFKTSAFVDSKMPAKVLAVQK